MAQEQGLDQFRVGQRDSPYVQSSEQVGRVHIRGGLVPEQLDRIEQVAVEASRFVGRAMPERSEPLLDAPIGAEHMEEIDVAASLGLSQFIEVPLTALPRLIG